MTYLRISFLLVLGTMMNCKQQNSTADTVKNDSIEITADNKESQKAKNETDQDEQETLVDKAKKEIPEINEVIKEFLQNKDSVIILVKISGKTELVKVLNRTWPDDIETTYNIFKNQQGQIIYIAEFPTSESGDWNLRLEHFFSATGQLTGFVKDFAFFNSPCLGEGVANEQLLELYDKDFKVIKTIKTLTDNKGKQLDEEKCGNAYYDVEYDIRPTAREFIELKGIKV